MAIAVQAGAVPLPVQAPAQKKQDWADRVAQFAEQSTGAWNLVKSVDHFCQYAILWAGAGSPTQRKMDDLRGKLAGPSSLFWIPLFYHSILDFGKKFNSILTASDLPASDAERQKKLNKATKATVIEGFNFVNLGTQIIMMAQSNKWIKLAASSIPAIDIVFNATNVVVDGSSLNDQPEKFREYRNLAVNGRTDAEKAYYRSKEYQAFNKMVKYTSSVGLSAIVLATYALGIAISSIAWLPPLLFGFAVTYLVTDIASIFFHNINEDKRKALGIAPD